MKVFIGTHENCGLVSNLSKGFEALGHDTTTWLKTRDKLFPDEKYNFDFTKYTLPTNKLEKVIDKIPVCNKVYSKLKNYFAIPVLENSFKNLPEHDLYIYTWSSALENLKELEYLKRKGKKIVFLFIGSEVRFAPAFNQEFPTSPIPWKKYHLNEDINKKLFFVRTIEKFADHIFSVPDQSGLLVRPYTHMYMPLIIDSIRFNYPDNEIPKIIHAPTNKPLKGTDRVLAALEILKAEGCKFEFTLIENKPNSYIKEELVKADILIDQLYGNGPATLSSEAMAAGCAVATRYIKGYEHFFNPPICYIDSETIVDNLRKLITDRQYRRNLGLNGRKFVEENNNPVSIAKKILGLYNGNKGEKYDYVPTFFIEKFQLEKRHKISKQNKVRNREIIERFYPLQVDWQSLKDRGLI